MKSWFLEAIDPADQWFQRRQLRRIREPRSRQALKIDYDPRTRYANGISRRYDYVPKQVPKRVPDQAATIQSWAQQRRMNNDELKRLSARRNFVCK